jgi:hypothetical protein
MAIQNGKTDVRNLLSDGTEEELLNDSSGFKPGVFSSKQFRLVATTDGDVLCP